MSITNGLSAVPEQGHEAAAATDSVVVLQLNSVAYAIVQIYLPEPAMQILSEVH